MVLFFLHLDTDEIIILTPTQNQPIGFYLGIYVYVNIVRALSSQTLYLGHPHIRGTIFTTSRKDPANWDTVYHQWHRAKCAP
jgi:hypothetical protein